MTGKKRQAAGATIEQVRAELESWRKTRAGSRIPERLWESAVELARVRGVNQVAKGLRLNYYDLKQRLEEAGAGTDVERRRPGPGFVEVKLPAGGGLAECTVKIEDRRGSRLTVELPGSSAGQIIEIAKALWRGRP